MKKNWRVVELLFFDKKRIKLGPALVYGGVIDESFNPDIIQTRPSVAGSGSSIASISICGAVTFFKISVYKLQSISRDVNA